MPREAAPSNQAGWGGKRGRGEGKVPLAFPRAGGPHGGCRCPGPRRPSPPRGRPRYLCRGFCDCAAQRLYLHQRREVPNGERGANQMAD